MFELIFHPDLPHLATASWRRSSSSTSNLQVLTPRRKFTRFRSILNQAGSIHSLSSWSMELCQLILLRCTEWGDWQSNTRSSMTNSTRDWCLCPYWSASGPPKLTMHFERCTRALATTTWGVSHRPTKYCGKNIIDRPCGRMLPIWCRNTINVKGLSMSKYFHQVNSRPSQHHGHLIIGESIYSILFHLSVDKVGSLLWPSTTSLSGWRSSHWRR